jgi:hypothetical protein
MNGYIFAHQEFLKCGRIKICFELIEICFGRIYNSARFEDNPEPLAPQPGILLQYNQRVRKNGQTFTNKKS